MLPSQTLLTSDQRQALSCVSHQLPVAQGRSILLGCQLDSLASLYPRNPTGVMLWCDHLSQPLGLL